MFSIQSHKTWPLQFLHLSFPVEACLICSEMFWVLYASFCITHHWTKDTLQIYPREALLHPWSLHGCCQTMPLRGSVVSQRVWDLSLRSLGGHWQGLWGTIWKLRFKRMWRFHTWICLDLEMFCWQPPGFYFCPNFLSWERRGMRNNYGFKSRKF